MEEIEKLDKKFKAFQKKCDPQALGKEDYSKWLQKVDAFLDQRLTLMKARDK